MPVEPRAQQWFNDPEAVCDAMLAGSGVGLIGMSHALPHLQSGRLVRLLPDWWGDVGSLVVYFPTNRLLPRKIRVFVDTLLDVARAQDWAGQLDARPAAMRPGARVS